jgi:hypothetical protein
MKRAFICIVTLAVMFGALGCAVLVKPDLETTAYIAGKSVAYAVAKDRDMTADEIAEADRALEAFEQLLTLEGDELESAVEQIMVEVVPGLAPESDRAFIASLMRDLASGIQGRDLSEDERKARAVAAHIVSGMRDGLGLVL